MEGAKERRMPPRVQNHRPCIKLHVVMLRQTPMVRNSSADDKVSWAAAALNNRTGPPKGHGCKTEFGRTGWGPGRAGEQSDGPGVGK